MQSVEAQPTTKVSEESSVMPWIRETVADLVRLLEESKTQNKVIREDLDALISVLRPMDVGSKGAKEEQVEKAPVSFVEYAQTVRVLISLVRASYAGGSGDVTVRIQTLNDLIVGS